MVTRDKQNVLSNDKDLVIMQRMAVPYSHFECAIFSMPSFEPAYSRKNCIDQLPQPFRASGLIFGSIVMFSSPVRRFA